MENDRSTPPGQRGPTIAPRRSAGSQEAVGEATISQHPPEELSEERRLKIFLALSDEQDLYEFSLAQARKRICHRFGVSEARLREIEREGRDKLWPPD
jgi:hypothetical protein